LNCVTKQHPHLRASDRTPILEVGMTLQEVFTGVKISSLSGPAHADIRSVAYDSRKVTRGALFFALQGEKADGNQFIPSAIEAGAIAVASEQPRPAEFSANIAWIQLPARSERRALATLAATFYGHPADSLQLSGVTGTNGKTTTTFLIDSILCAAGHTTGLIGTTGYRTPLGSRTAVNTTPESLDLQQMMAEVRDAGGSHVVLEASSHALVMDRLWGCRFAAAVFTNLTREHMDYHNNFDDYFAAKRRLFEGTGAGVPIFGVVNTDDPYGHLLKEVAEHTLTYGLENGAQITTKKFALSFSGLEFIAQTPSGKIEVKSRLVGRVNVYNILAAIGAALALQIPAPAIEAGIRRLDAVPGRFQQIDEGQPFLVIVDYAHTDDAIRNLLTLARELHPSGRIIILFGAGGERDRTKRPLMGEAAGSLSELVVLTSDNPRSEDPLLIINDVVVGLQRVNGTYRIEPDRERALEIVLDESRPGDMVLLAGKGHENYQVLRDRTFEFDDREMARASLRRRGYRKVAART
jgi:UDP-N-acetylmuramoyl-L-alanyl-D-glutamate--2,6-diaminopimelate ligase